MITISTAGRLTHSPMAKKWTSFCDLFVWKDLDPINGKEMVCDTKCKKDCKFTHYQNDSQQIFRDKNEVFTFINIKHNSAPDILVTHSPEITFNAFVCNFGGLLGLWLGLSVFTTSYEILDLIIKLFGERQRIRKMILVNLNHVKIHFNSIQFNFNSIRIKFPKRKRRVQLSWK